MKHLKTIRLIYLVYTIYTIFVISVSDYNIWIALLGLLCIWLIYFAYSLGYRSVKITSIDSKDDQGDDVAESIEHKEEYDEATSIIVHDDRFVFSEIVNWKPIQYILATSISWICSIFAAKFYTSRGFSSVILGIFRGEKAYSIYQHYMVDANIGAFKLTKIPFILMLVFCTMMLFWSMLGLLLSGEKLKVGQVVYLVSTVLSYFYFGLARGTNFEMYIIFVLFVYCLLNRPGTALIDERKRRRAIIVISVLAVAVIIVFRMVVAARGNVFSNQICSEIHYDDTKLISRLFPTLTNIGLSVFRYFGFGIFTIGTTIDNIVFGSAQGFGAFMLPVGFQLFYNSDLMVLVREIVDIGVGWVPDCISFVNIFGFPLTLIVFLALGRLTRKIYSSDRSGLLKNLLGAFMFIEMLSIPVGNFIVTSTPNELTIFLVFLWLIKGRLRITLGRRNIL